MDRLIDVPADQKHLLAQFDDLSLGGWSKPQHARLVPKLPAKVVRLIHSFRVIPIGAATASMPSISLRSSRTVTRMLSSGCPLPWIGITGMSSFSGASTALARAFAIQLLRVCPFACGNAVDLGDQLVLQSQAYIHLKSPVQRSSHILLACSMQAPLNVQSSTARMAHLYING